MQRCQRLGRVRYARQRPHGGHVHARRRPHEPGDWGGALRGRPVSNRRPALFTRLRPRRRQGQLGPRTPRALRVPGSQEAPRTPCVRVPGHPRALSVSGSQDAPRAWGPGSQGPRTPPRAQCLRAPGRPAHPKTDSQVLPAPRGCGGERPRRPRPSVPRRPRPAHLTSSAVRVGAVPAGGRGGRAAPHAVCVGGQLAHVAQAAVAIAAHGAVRELRDAGRHVVRRRPPQPPPLPLPPRCGPPWRAGAVCPPRPPPARRTRRRRAVGGPRGAPRPGGVRVQRRRRTSCRSPLDGAQDVGHGEGRRVLGAQRHGLAGGQVGGPGRARVAATSAAAAAPVTRVGGAASPRAAGSGVYFSPAPGLRQTRGRSNIPKRANNGP